MQCDCRKDLEQRLAEHLKQDLPEGFRDFSASLQGYGLILSSPVEERLSVNYLGEVWVPKKDSSKGHKRQKIDVNITASYCPFCGKAAKAENDEEVA